MLNFRILSSLCWVIAINLILFRMKRIISKPENWQDFESLCKKLWGEIWEIPHKIKKNGRLGQPQSGVDIYGIPKNEFEYWGIQCKGRDEYTSAKLTKADIDKEIRKAKTFQPKLKVFIIATTANKDVEIEEYVRVKDFESRSTNEFEILLYCWEDIADLIEENRITFNYYVNQKQFKTSFDFKVFFSDFKPEITLRPQFERTIRRYRLTSQGELLRSSLYESNLLKGIEAIQKLNSIFPSFNHKRINYSICSLKIFMVNEGSSVIEDWKINITVEGEFRMLKDAVRTGYLGMVDLAYLKNKETFIEGNEIFYTPRDNRPLIQKDHRYFEIHIIPNAKSYRIPLKWNLLARDYNSEGYIYLNIEPEIETKVIYEEVDSSDDILPEQVSAIKEKKNYDDDMGNEINS
jgi:hypothetical protein